MSQHLNRKSNLCPQCINAIYYIEYVEFNSECDMSIMEIYLINYYNPQYNKDSNNHIGEIKLDVPQKWNEYNEKNNRLIARKLHGRQKIIKNIKFNKDIFTDTALDKYINTHLNTELSVNDKEMLCQFCKLPEFDADKINNYIAYNNSKVFLIEENGIYTLIKKQNGRFGYGSLFQRKDGRYAYKMKIDGKTQTIYGYNKLEIADKYEMALLESGQLIG